VDLDHAGRKRAVSREITPDRLAVWNIDRERVVAPSEFAIMVELNSVDPQTGKLTVR
jgi:hypothetical protein